MKRWVTLIAVLLGLLALGGCGKRYEWKQKITVEVETPNGIKSGASVQHIKWNVGDKKYSGLDGPSSSAEVIGEAVVVDLGGKYLGGKYLFALLKGTKTFKGEAYGIASFALWGAREAIGTAEGNQFLVNLPIGTRATLEPDNYPMLVTFADIAKPKTVQLVDPANLAATFGEGYALKSISVEITDEKVSEGTVERVLGWVADYKSKRFRLNGSKCIACPVDSKNLADLLGTGAFKIESN